MRSKSHIRPLVFLLLTACRQIVGIEPRQISEEDASAPVLRACELPVREPTCASCMAMNCCKVAGQCAADPPCSCFETCAPGDSSCRLKCSGRWDPIDSRSKLQDCRDTSCAAACGGPWECLGHVKWQVPEVIPRTVTIRATAMCLACNPVGENGPNEGVRVRVCSIDDPECSAPLQTEQKTDSNGKVVLDVSTALYPHPLSVFLEFHKEGWLDALLLLNTPPLSYDFDVGEVDMHRQEDVDRIAAGLMTQYDPDKAMVVMSVSNCNLGPGTGIDLGWNDPGQAVIRPSASSSGWPVFAVNLPIGNGLARVVARRTPPDPAQDGATAPIVAVVNLVVRKGAITLAPFVTPTPSPVTPTP